MTSQPRLLETNTPVVLACLGHAANTYCPAHPILRLATAKTQAVDRAPTLSNDATARKTPGRGLDLPTAVASKASIPTEKSIS